MSSLFSRILLSVFLFANILFSSALFAAGNSPTDAELNVRNMNHFSTTGKENTDLNTFATDSRISDFFFSPGTSGDGIINTFIMIAFGIKNFFLAIAVIFLVIGVLKLLFSGGGDEDVKKWKNNIIWVSVGIIFMQMAFSIWQTFLITDPVGGIGSGMAWRIWSNVFSPLVDMLQLFAAGAFLLMALYAFYTIVTGGGDEEKLKKGKQMVIYGLIGFVLIRLPKAIVSAIYGAPEGCTNSGSFLMTTVEECVLTKNELSGTLEIVGKIIGYFNGFLTLLCVIMVIYAGWLVLISGGDEEKLKKAKNIVIYILIGLVILVASHAIFRFFIMQ